MTDGPVLNQVNLVVSDMDATIAFYERLGLTVPDTDPAWRAHHRTVEAPGGIDLEFDSEQSTAIWNEGWAASRRPCVLGFGVPSREAVDELYTTLTTAGSTGQLAPHDAFWGSRYAIVEDPDGNPVGIMSPPDPAFRSAPRSP